MTAIVNITTFRGMSVEAVHYYGQLVIIGSENVELFRPISNKDLEKYPDRFHGYEIGDLTRCFNTWRDVVLAAGEKAKEKDIDLKEVVVEGIPNTQQLPYYKALEPLDTRPKCKKCGKVIKPGEGCYNSPRGLFCTKCY